MADIPVILFLVSFVGALLWYRLLFVVVPVYFKRPLTRSVLKIHWHHLHWGIVFVFLGVLLYLFSEYYRVITILFGIGLGLIIDLFIPSLLLKTDRENELVVYRSSLIHTLFLGMSIVAVVILLGVLL